MSALTQVKEGIWRWDGVDADHGFPIVGYIVNLTGHPLLVDPPGTSGSEERDPCDWPAGGDRPHQRMACPRARPAGPRCFGIPIAAHESATVDELQELGGSLDIELKEGDEFFGWKVLHLSAASEQLPF